MMDYELDVKNINESGLNCLILGFPKCGTTSLASWLDGSDEVTVTNPKETYLYSYEFHETHPPLITHDVICGMKRSRVFIEASTLNVYSKKLREILSVCTQIKVIVMIRDVQDVIPSWHSQMKNSGFVFDTDLSEFLNHDIHLCEVDSFSSPKTFLSSYLLAMSYGFWLKKWIDSLGTNRVLIVHQDELSDSASLEKRIERFLGVKLKINSDIPRLNQRSVARFPKLYAFIRDRKLKALYYSIEKNIKIFVPIRRYIRENFLLKKVNGDQKKLNLDSLSDDKSTAFLLYEENKKLWF